MPASQSFLYGYTFTGTPGGTITIDTQVGAPNPFILTDTLDSDDGDDQTNIDDHVTLTRWPGGPENDYVLRGLTSDGGVIVQAGAGTGAMYIYSDVLYTGGETLTSDVTTPYTYCFGPGTGIATPDGPAAVETLKPGDRVLTAEGQEVPVLWIGRQTQRPRFFDVGLVRLRKGALGDGLPARDLMVTSDHALLIDGLLVQAGVLVNGDSIVAVPRRDLPQTLTVYHVETPGHVVILAEDTPCETFIDAAGRHAFDNYAEYATLVGPDRIIPECPAPRVASARMLPQAMRERLGIAEQDEVLSA
ncbi:Hint domain-containing protein [Psychromarinibacter sp. S121]|uniref:Hint domain-containing protein n=1 Tax=Psychromarinibacter sp. S121 TaxID=3415127 RepID=UPI003C7E4C6F